MRQIITRRSLLSSAALLPLVAAGCGGEAGKLPALPVEVKLPPELTTLIEDANLVFKKVSELKMPAAGSSLLTQLRAVVDRISGSTTIDGVKEPVSKFASVIDRIKSYLPSTGTVGKIVKAVDTVLPIMMKVAGLVSMFAAERPTGLTPAQARMILRS